MFLTEHGKELVEQVLDEGRVVLLYSAFIWGDTPQGYPYWSYIADGRSPFTAEARAILESWVGRAPSSSEVESEPKVEDTTEYQFMDFAVNSEGVIEYGSASMGKIVPGSLEVSCEVSGGGNLGNTYAVTRASLYNSSHLSFRNFPPIRADNYVLVEVLEDGTYKLIGDLPKTATNFGFKSLEDVIFAYDKVYRKEAYGEGHNWDARYQLEELFEQARFYNSNCELPGPELRAAITSTWWWRPEFSSDGVSFFANYRDLMRNRKSKTTLGRFLRKILPSATDQHIEKATDLFNLRYRKRDFTLHRGETRANFKHAYLGDQAVMLNPKTSASRKSLANSCMRETCVNGMSPAEVFASGDFEILWLEDSDGNIGGRVVVRKAQGDTPPQAGPLYGVCEHSLDLLKGAVSEMGATPYNNADWHGAKLLKIEACDGYLMIYLDLAGDVGDSGDHFVIGGGDYEADSTEGVICGDSSDRYYCEDCEERVYEDELYYSPDGACLCESCFNSSYTCCDVSNETISRDDAVEVYTNTRAYLWGGRTRTTLTVDSNIVDYAECEHTGETWLLENMLSGPNDTWISPIYAPANLTEVDGIWYTQEELIEHGLQEKEEDAA